ncbi:MAG: glutathione S-transferase family protein [Deltaproteobacteria bacterium]|nr:glutathione S-transferase family protein [Deltaproteobacteria bacterium]
MKRSVVSEDERVHHRLITLPFSHYNEKARWALDRYAVPYREEPHMPFVCSIAVAVATRGRGGAADRTSSRYSTPVLILDDGRILTDSTDIVRFAAGRDDSLFPNTEVSDLVAHYGDQLGPYTRLLAYWHLGRHPGMIEQLAADNVGRREAWAFRRIVPLVGSQLTRGFNLTESGHDRALTRLRQELDDAASRLEHRNYLCGDRFTAADLTFAALLAPGLCLTAEEGFGAILPDRASLDEKAQALISEVRAHPAGQFALRMYAEERRSG